MAIYKNITSPFKNTTGNVVTTTDQIAVETLEVTSGELSYTRNSKSLASVLEEIETALKYDKDAVLDGLSYPQLKDKIKSLQDALTALEEEVENLLTSGGGSNDANDIIYSFGVGGADNISVKQKIDDLSSSLNNASSSVISTYNSILLEKTAITQAINLANSNINQSNEKIESCTDTLDNLTDIANLLKVSFDTDAQSAIIGSEAYEGLTAEQKLANCLYFIYELV